MPILPEYFKEAMSNLVSSVTAISSNGSDGQLHGLTASSVASVSLTPPLILFCLNSKSHSLSSIQTSKKFAISLLSEGQEDIARNFASSNLDKFATINYTIGEFSACPLIAGANFWIECSLYADYNGGDHRIIVGKVENLIAGTQKRPLAYYNRDYRKIT